MTTIKLISSASTSIQVIAACGGSEKCELMKRRGAQHVIDYRREDVRARVLEITNGNGADVICDNVGGQDEFRTLLRWLVLNTGA